MILSTHGILQSGGISFVGLLDNYPNAAAAYSLRKLRAGYGGNAIKVRRSSDNTEADIGFTALGNLDTTALTSFCSGTDGFVTTWYDQSGNGRNATQTTAANQPQIVSSGSVLTLTGIGSARPILRFDGTNDSFNFSTITAAQFTTFYPQKKNASADLSAWFSRTVGTVSPFSPIIFGNVGTYIGNATKTTYSAGYNNNNYILISGYINSSNDGFIQINNSAITLGSTLGPSGTNEFTSINQRGGSGYSKCDVPEMIFYPSDNSSNLSNINTNINTYYGIY
jgi:hypothetical protein